MKLNRKQLLAALESVSPGLTKKDVIEQSSCFVFKGDRLHTFNDEVACSAPNPLNGINGAVPAKPLLDLLNKLTADVVDVEQKDELLIKCKEKNKDGKLVVTRKAGIRIEKEVVLPVDSIDVPDEWKDLPDGFSDAVDVVYRCTARDDSNMSLGCVCLAEDWMEACDNYQLIRWPIDLPLEGLCLVRGDAIKSVIGKGMTGMAVAKSWVHFRNGDGLVMSCRKLGEDHVEWWKGYVKLGEILKAEGVETKLPPGLEDAVSAAGVFSEDGVAGETVLVKLAKGKLSLRGEGPDGWYEERKEVEWDGEPLEFLVNPKLLTEIVKRTDTCIVTPGQMRIETDKFQYVACLGKRE